MYVEIDQVVLPSKLWIGVLDHDESARAEVRKIINDLHLSTHALHVPPEWHPVIAVSLRDLDQFGLVSGVLVQAAVYEPEAKSV